MDNREILTRFKNGTLEREHALALLTATPLTNPPGLPGLPAAPGAAGAAGLAVSPAPPALSLPAVPLGSAVAVGSAVPVVAAALAGQAGTPDPGPGLGWVGERYAVTGVSGRFPGAGDLSGWWQHLLQERGGAGPVPPGRPAAAGRPAAGRRAAGRPGAGGVGGVGGGGRGWFVEGVEEFDAAFFGLTDAEGALLDPQERLFVECAWQLLECAGYAGARLEGLRAADGQSRSLGVYVAAGPGDYALLTAGCAGAGGGAGRAGGVWSLPNRLSALLDVHGPSQCVDAAEASFLVAVHQALAALRAKECAAALVGAVDLRLHPGRHGGGEGVGAILLRPLDAAQAAGDTVHALVCASAVAHTGRFPAPGAPAGSGGAVEARLERRAADLAGVEVGQVEVHESAATAAAGMGDAGAATGLAALLRAVLQLHHATRLPVPATSPAAAWPAPRDGTGRVLPRRATARARGTGGTAAHVLLEESPRPARQQEQQQQQQQEQEQQEQEQQEQQGQRQEWQGWGEQEEAQERGGLGEGGVRAGLEEELVLLSAPTPAHLAATARRLADALTVPAGCGLALAEVARELALGRAVRECRLVVTARTTAELAAALTAFTTTDPEHDHGPDSDHDSDPDRGHDGDGGRDRDGDGGRDRDGDGGRDRDAGRGGGHGGAGGCGGVGVVGRVRSADLRSPRAEAVLLADLPETAHYVAALWRAGRLEALARLWLAGVDVTGGAAARCGGGVVALPPSVLLRRRLWAGEETGGPVR
ncbi:beta-ketoacyl [acyl carrier protein] synthase domain-containing protein [Streptomyces sp. SAS_270]|uniref:beta-ketoacyl [acyl carrier protein] synthase domain-containing protein n=1 Tax=Streptomyces sp. SAS_270 TaxID=3412748 RepID=UPI00403C69FC